LSAQIQLRGVSYTFGDRSVLNRVSFEAASGEFVALMGANGAGKSTLLDLIAGLRQPAEGTIHLEGRALPEWPAADLARRISHLPQSIPSDLPFRVEQLVLMGRYPHTGGWHESPDDHKAVQRAMLRTNCRQFRERHFGTLSGGERQRVLLASCLAQQAGVMLLDEPSTFLDIDQQLHCFSLLRQEAANGAICIAVTHDLNLALAHCTRVVVLKDQGIAADIAVRDAGASPEWLALFSTRLRMGKTPDGNTWVWFQ